MKKTIPIPEIIARCDEFFNAGKSAEVGEFLRSWRQKAQEYGDCGGELTIVNELIGHYRMNGDVSRGLEAVTDALELLELTGITGTVNGGTILLNGATALHSFGKNGKALELFQQAYSCYAENLPPDDLHFAGLLNNMSAVYADGGDFAAAAVCCQEAGDILQKEGKVLDFALTLVNLAQLHLRFAPDSPELSGILDKVMGCFDDPAVPKDGYYAHNCTKCAPVFSAAGQPEREAELLARAKEIYESA